MTALKFACISARPPIIVREVGKGREREVQRTIDAHEPVSLRRFQVRRLR